MFKNKLNNYIATEVLKSYLLILISFSLLIWVAQAAKFLSLITQNGLSIETYLTYIILIFPKILSQLMLVSFLISLSLTILKLSSDKELDIYWISGISKLKLSILIIKISIIPTLLALIFYLLIVPFSNMESRKILIKSEFSMVESLVKKKNFNSPLKGLTIFVGENDNKGNLKKIYIFEKIKTIIAREGRVLNIKNKNYLELTDGFIHEKDKNNNINLVKFKKTLFDFTKYQTGIIKQPKIQELSTLKIINYFFKKDNKKKEYLHELNKRIVKPLFIPLISLLCCFLFYSNKEKINLTNLKIFIFSFTSLLIIFIEIMLGLSIKNIFFQFTYYSFPLTGFILTFFLLNKFLKNEAIAK